MKMKVALILSLVAGALAMPRASVQKGPGAGRIVGGEAALETEFPHGVSLETNQGDGGTWSDYCGGAIYDETRILTSALCCYGGGGEVRVVAGDDDRSVESGREQIRLLDNVQIHPDFDVIDQENGWDNDICIVTLFAPLVFNSRVQPVRLAEATSVPSGAAVASGYGAVETDGGLSSGKLLKATLNIMQNSECVGTYENSTFIPGMRSYFPGITSTNLCAEGEGKFVCGGDMGSPLVAKDSANRVVLAGIASWSTWLCEAKLPNVYSNIAALRGWLDSALNP